MIIYDALTLIQSVVHIFSFNGLILCSCSISDLFTFPSERTNLKIHGNQNIFLPICEVPKIPVLLASVCWTFIMVPRV